MVSRDDPAREPAVEVMSKSKQLRRADDYDAYSRVFTRLAPPPIPQSTTSPADEAAQGGSKAPESSYAVRALPVLIYLPDGVPVIQEVITPLGTDGELCPSLPSIASASQLTIGLPDHPASSAPETSPPIIPSTGPVHPTQPRRSGPSISTGSAAHTGCGGTARDGAGVVGWVYVRGRRVGEDRYTIKRGSGGQVAGLSAEISETRSRSVKL